jgi:hypothetical protein
VHFSKLLLAIVSTFMVWISWTFDHISFSDGSGKLQTTVSTDMYCNWGHTDPSFDTTRALSMDPPTCYANRYRGNDYVTCGRFPHNVSNSSRIGTYIRCRWNVFTELLPSNDRRIFFVETPFYLQSVYIHSANWCEDLAAMAWGGALSALLQLLGLWAWWSVGE